MNKLNKLAIAALVAGVTACNNSPYKGYEKTETGLLYKFHRQNSDARKPSVGDFAHM